MAVKHLLDPAVCDKGYFPIDLSITNLFWDTHDVSDIATFERYLKGKRHETKRYVAYGGYLEQRALYRLSKRFQDGAIRDTHMGIDLWAPAGTSVHAVMDGIVHSFANNADAGNYGPTLVLEHDWRGKKLYSLYGHLAVSDMAGWAVGLRFRESERIATLGTPRENGGYSPHLHFQVMATMADFKGDFAGVLAVDQLVLYENLILDPNPFIF
jgi:murein DD-endopeptidase MepM/ murein hydrolase activator NlpD